MKKQIKVAMIPDNTRIILNVGYEDSDNLEEGKEIEIYEPGIEILDPDTKEVIGSYDLVKERLELTDIYATYSVARKIKKETKRTGLAYALSSPLLQEKTVYIAHELDVNMNENLDLKIENKTINIGDYAKIL